MPENTTLIVTLKRDSQDIEENGKIISFSSDATSMNTVCELAMEKLGIASNVPLTDIVLLDSSHQPINTMDQVRQQQVVYVDLKSKIKDVPGPPKYPFVGSIGSLLPDVINNYVKLFAKYGPLVNVSIFGVDGYSTNDPAIAEIFVKESEYFTKKITKDLAEVRKFAGDGLFTSNTDEENWELAHKLLMPAFSPRAIKAYLDEMGHISMETIRTLEQFQPTEKVDMVDWSTRLTFETIGRCGFGYNFGLLSSRDAPAHPFIDAMAYCLKTAVVRSINLSIVNKFSYERNRRFDEAVKLMNDTVSQVIQDRKNSPDAGDMNKDLMGFMLNARDEHNLGLSDQNIAYQVITFLIAGHDTTANTLAWTIYELSRNPKVETRLLQEIADVGITHDKIPTVEQISQLKYLHKVIKETLRKYPPVQMLLKYCKKDCIVPGGYLIKANTPSDVNVYALHHNPQVYPDPERYDPERFSPEEEQKRSQYSWLPFSTGPRGCLGMAFAIQELKVVLPMLLHRFKFFYDGPDVTFDQQGATAKPMDFFVNIHPRTDMPAPRSPTTAAAEDAKPVSDKPKAVIPESKAVAEQVASRPAAELPPITFLFGTQTGTAQDYASQLASQARSFGFKDVKFQSMDQWHVILGNEPKAQELVVICTATYNGQPPESAERFNKFINDKLKDQQNNALKALRFAVFGVGNKNWRTYQVFPRKVNDCLERLGAERFFDCGQGNADKDMDADFNEWSAHFWVHALTRFGLSLPQSQWVVPSANMGQDNQHVKVNFINPAVDESKWEAGLANRNGEYNATILLNEELQQPASDRSTRHIELDVSSLQPLCEDGSLFLAGDHLEVYPENDAEIVDAIAVNFGWVLDSVFEVDSASLDNVSPRSLAASIQGPCTIRNALTYYADLSSPPSRTMLAIFAEQLSNTSPDTAEAFRKLIMPDSPEYASFIEKYRTILDLQKGFPQVKRLDLAQFMTAVGVMQPRRYSISSSPLAHPKQASLTVGVVHDVLKDGREYYGLASSYLARSAESTKIRAMLKSSKSSFALPSDPKVPIIMIAAGTGVAPFRGFLEERACQRSQGKQVGDCVLFFGCRRKDQDFIYAEEMQQHVENGVLKDLHVAFSRQDQPIKYVQHQILEHAVKMWKLLQHSNASVYVCGAGTMSRDVRRTFCSMAKSFGHVSTDEEAEDFIGDLIEQGRYNEDVWG